MARFMMLVIGLHLIIRIWPSLYFHCFLYFTPFAIDMVEFFLRCDYTSLFWTLSWINVGLHGFRVWVWVWHFVLLLKFWRKKWLPKLCVIAILCLYTYCLSIDSWIFLLQSSSKPVVLSFYDLFSGLVDDIVPYGSGPYLSLDYLEQWYRC